MKGTQRTRFVEGHLPLVRHLAARMIQRARPYLEMDDLIAIGTEALLRAFERFDPRRGVSFGTFAYLRVRGAMCEGIGVVGPVSRGVIRRRKGRPERRALPILFRLDDNNVGPTPRPADLEEELAVAIDAARLGPRLRGALDTLDERGRQIILRHYFGGDTLNDIGRDMGHSRSWASRMHARALARLRAALYPDLAACDGPDPAGAACDGRDLAGAACDGPDLAGVACEGPDRAASACDGPDRDELPGHGPAAAGASARTAGCARTPAPAAPARPRRRTADRPSPSRAAQAAESGRSRGRKRTRAVTPPSAAARAA
jgi:RNA polymerase sigma factor for flagellar operon FliA